MIATAAATPVEFGVMIILIAAAIVVALALAVLATSFGRLRETTLLTPAIWALISLAMMVCIQAMLLRVDSYSSTREKLDLIAATSTFSPFMALLGAKRPQNGAWSWIVLSLWGIAAWPAIESLAANQGESLEIHPIWKCFYAVLVVAGVCNYLPTKFWFPALIVGLSQCALLGRALPAGEDWIVPLRSQVADTMLPELIISGRRDYHLWNIAAGIVPISLATCAAYFLANRRRHSIDAIGAGWNRVWLDFRDRYGVQWSFRVIERVNAKCAAAMGWNGIRTDYLYAAKFPAEAYEPAAHDTPAENAISVLQSTLTRFVSNAWIERRL